VLVRFFAGQPPDMAEKARRLVAAADAGDVLLEVLPLISAETLYTVESSPVTTSVSGVAVRTTCWPSGRTIRLPHGSPRFSLRLARGSAGGEG